MRKKHISAEPIYRLRCIVYYIPQDCLDMSHAVNYLARDRHCFTCLLWLHSHIFCNVFLLTDGWMNGKMDGVHWMNSFKINALHDCMKYDIEIPMISYVWGQKWFMHLHYTMTYTSLFAPPLNHIHNGKITPKNNQITINTKLYIFSILILIHKSKEQRIVCHTHRKTDWNTCDVISINCRSLTPSVEQPANMCTHTIWCIFLCCFKHCYSRE